MGRPLQPPIPQADYGRRQRSNTPRAAARLRHHVAVRGCFVTFLPVIQPKPPASPCRCCRAGGGAGALGACRNTSSDPLRTPDPRWERCSMSVHVPFQPNPRPPSGQARHRRPVNLQTDQRGPEGFTASGLRGPVAARSEANTPPAGAGR